MKGYIIFDGRAMFDTDEAAILEACCEGGRRELRKSLQFWRGHDAVLVEYKADNGELTDERLIGHINDGIDVLLARCSE